MSSIILGKIFTSTSQGLVDALVIRDGKVLYVGDASTAATQALPDATVVDYGGRVILPGFIDSHSHLSMMGASLLKPNLVACKSLEDIKRVLVENRAQNPTAERLLGRAWIFHTLVDESGAIVRPHRKFLDSILPGVPVYLDSVDLHSIWCSTAALEELGVDRTVEDPKGGSWERDEDGELTGLVLETPVVETVWPFLANKLSDAARDAAFRAVFDAYLTTGVTGAIDMAMEGSDLRALERAYASYGSQLPLRIAMHWIISPLGTDEDRLARVQEAIEHRDRLAKHSPWLRMVGIKIVVDGVVDSCTAHLLEPYANGTHPGPIWSLEELIPVATLADKAGLQIALHAIGDAASALALDALEAATKTNGNVPDRRHRIEHLEVVTKESIARMKRCGVTASLQPVHADPALTFNWHAQLGHDKRCERNFPWSEFVDAGVNIALGTDAPTAPYESLPNLYVATTRKSALEPDAPFPPPDVPILEKLQHFRFSLKDALLGATKGGAHSCHADAEVGSLAPGLSADFAVLSIDPFKDGVETLARAQEAVDETWVAGKRVFKR